MPEGRLKRTREYYVTGKTQWLRVPASYRPCDIKGCRALVPDSVEGALVPGPYLCSDHQGATVTIPRLAGQANGLRYNDDADA
jgi:hypothetical protein